MTSKTIERLKVLRLILGLGAGALLLLAFSLHLARGQQQTSPAQLANGICSAVIQSANLIERQEQEITQLKKQLAEKPKEDPHAQH